MSDNNKYAGLEILRRQITGNCLNCQGVDVISKTPGMTTALDTCWCMISKVTYMGLHWVPKYPAVLISLWLRALAGYFCLSVYLAFSYVHDTCGTVYMLINAKQWHIYNATRVASPSNKCKLLYESVLHDLYPTKNMCNKLFILCVRRHFICSTHINGAFSPGSNRGTPS